MSSHFATFTPDPSNDGDDEWAGEFTFECVAPVNADCRFECDCDEWFVSLGSDGTAWHVTGGIMQAHQMRPVSCTIADWFESDEMGEHLNPPREGRHEIECEWMGYGYHFHYLTERTDR